MTRRLEVCMPSSRMSCMLSAWLAHCADRRVQRLRRAPQRSGPLPGLMAPSRDSHPQAGQADAAATLSGFRRTPLRRQPPGEAAAGAGRSGRVMPLTGLQGRTHDRRRPPPPKLPRRRTVDAPERKAPCRPLSPPCPPPEKMAAISLGTYIIRPQVSRDTNSTA